MIQDKATEGFSVHMMQTMARVIVQLACLLGVPTTSSIDVVQKES